MSELEKLALETFSRGSKTFSLAARFFPKKMMVSSALIYYWCRYSDDLFDEHGGDLDTLSTLRRDTEAVWVSPSAVKELPFLALAKVREEVDLPLVYPLELINGMEMDLLNSVYRDLDALKLYCYRVASTVGLMMCHVMGLFHLGALKEAAELGMAMQLTNIARDVKADFILGRVYLPLDWLEEVGLTRKNFFDPQQREKLYAVVSRLINESEKLYDSGLEGTKHLPVGSAFTILVAGRIYRQIGRDILRIGVGALEARTTVSLPMKVWLIFTSLFQILLQMPYRVSRRKRGTIKISETWVYA